MYEDDLYTRDVCLSCVRVDNLRRGDDIFLNYPLKKPVQGDLGCIHSTGDGLAPCLDRYLFSTIIELCYYGKDVVHYRLIPDEYGVLFYLLHGVSRLEILLFHNQFRIEHACTRRTTYGVMTHGNESDTFTQPPD